MAEQRTHMKQEYEEEQRQQKKVCVFVHGEHVPLKAEGGVIEPSS